MSTIFLSASVPLVGRGSYYETANPFLIQCAVRELVIAVIRQCKIVWGGHPAITPMIWSICEDLGVDYSQSVILYQSAFFEDHYPEENQCFQNVIVTDADRNDMGASLKIMRTQMLSREDLTAAVFIGGMDGVKIEHDLFRGFHPAAKVLAVPSPGGAALELAKLQCGLAEAELMDIDFARLFHKHLAMIIDSKKS
ncbi:SLOG domain-containing protein [Aeromonas encheleia]